MHFAGVSGGGVAAVAAAVLDPLAGSLAAAPVLTPLPLPLSTTVPSPAEAACIEIVIYEYKMLMNIKTSY